YRSERSKLFRQIVRSDRNLAAQVRVVVAPGKRWILGLFAETSQAGNEHVLQSRLIDANVANVQAGLAAKVFDDLARFVRIMRQDIKTVAKSLDIHDVLLRTGYLRQHAFNFAQVVDANFQPLGAQTFSQFRRSADFPDLALV